MPIDERTILFTGPFGGLWDQNVWGLDPNWITNPAAFLQSNAALANQFGIKNIVIFAPAGVLQGQFIPSSLWEALLPAPRRAFEERLHLQYGPNINWGVHFGWGIPKHRNPTNISMPGLLPASDGRLRMDWLRRTLMPAIALADFKIASFDASSGDAQALAETAADLRKIVVGTKPFKSMGEAIPVIQTGTSNDPAYAAAGGFTYAPDTRFLRSAPWEASFQFFKTFDPYFQWNFAGAEVYCVVYAPTPGVPFPTRDELAALRRNNVIICVGGMDPSLIAQVLA